MVAHTISHCHIWLWLYALTLGVREYLHIYIYTYVDPGRFTTAVMIHILIFGSLLAWALDHSVVMNVLLVWVLMVLAAMCVCIGSFYRPQRSSHTYLIVLGSMGGRSWILLPFWAMRILISFWLLFCFLCWWHCLRLRCVVGIRSWNLYGRRHDSYFDCCAALGVGLGAFHLLMRLGQGVMMFASCLAWMNCSDIGETPASNDTCNILYYMRVSECLCG